MAGPIVVDWGYEWGCLRTVRYHYLERDQVTVTRSNHSTTQGELSPTRRLLVVEAAQQGLILSPGHRTQPSLARDNANMQHFTSSHAAISSNSLV